MMNFRSSCFWIILMISVVSGQYCGKITTQGSKNDTHAYKLRTLDDMTIFVEERGNINNPTIIFTHGYFASRLAWEPTFTSHRMLNQYHLVRWDLRGMGDSSKDGDVNKYNDLKFYANDVKLVVDDVKGRKAKANAKNNQIILVTWSTGSIATLPYFGTFTDSEVDGYVSVGNNFKSFKSENIFTEFTRVTIGGVVTSETYILILDSLKNLFTKMTPANAPLNPPSLSFLIGIGAYAPTESRHAYGQLDYDFTSTFANLSIPTLSIFGSEDQIVNPVHSQQVSASRPENGLNSVLAYNGIGHVPMWEIPKKFELDLDNWIKRSIINPKPKNPKASSPINNNKQPDQPVKNPQEQSKQPQPKSV